MDWRKQAQLLLLQVFNITYSFSLLYSFVLLFFYSFMIDHHHFFSFFDPSYSFLPYLIWFINYRLFVCFHTTFYFFFILKTLTLTLAATMIIIILLTLFFFILTPTLFHTYILFYIYNMITAISFCYMTYHWCLFNSNPSYFTSIITWLWCMLWYSCNRSYRTSHGEVTKYTNTKNHAQKHGFENISWVLNITLSV